MRIWTIHPKYLDPQGLVALWREGLLAQKVLSGQTRGYKSHPQLIRFSAQSEPAASIAAYLRYVYEESLVRGYRFDSTRIVFERLVPQIAETEGQLFYEWEHLKAKLRRRAPQKFAYLAALAFPEPHPLFTIVPGEVRDWERLRR